MLKITRLSGESDRFGLVSVERGSTPEPAMTLGIRLPLDRLSILNTISILDNSGVKRCRSTVHNWVQKAALQPADGADLDHVVVGETVMQFNDERFWLYATVDPQMTRLLHVKLPPTRNEAITEMVLTEC